MSQIQNTCKIAIPSSAPGGLEAIVNPRFGRCEFFTVVKIDQGNIQEVNVIPNQGINAMGGSGPMAAQLIASEGATVVIGGNYGPNAAGALIQGGIQTYGYPPNHGEMTVKKIIESYLAGNIPSISGSNVPSHFGMGGGGMGGSRGHCGGGGMGGGNGGRGGPNW